MKGEMLLKLSQSFGTGTGAIISHFDLGCTTVHPLAAQNQRGQLTQFPDIFFGQAQIPPFSDLLLQSPQDEIRKYSILVWIRIFFVPVMLRFTAVGTICN